MNKLVQVLAYWYGGYVGCGVELLGRLPYAYLSVCAVKFINLGSVL